MQVEWNVQALQDEREQENASAGPASRTLQALMLHGVLSTVHTGLGDSYTLPCPCVPALKSVGGIC
jgi:hypothetical protein